MFISELSIDQESKFIADLGLSAMLVFGGLIAIFIGVGLVYKEIDKRTIYNLLSKPIERHEFIIGKYVGLSMTLLVNSAIMVIGTELALVYTNRGLVQLQISVLPAAYLIFLELLLLVAGGSSLFGLHHSDAGSSLLVCDLRHRSFQRRLAAGGATHRLFDDTRHPDSLLLSAAESLELRVHSRVVTWSNRASGNGAASDRLCGGLH